MSDRAPPTLPQSGLFAEPRWEVAFDAEDTGPSLQALSAVLACQADPEAVLWRDRAAGQFELLDAGCPLEPPPAEARPLQALKRLPSGFAALAREALMHESPQRFVLLHRFGRALQAEPGRWQDTLDPGRLALERLAREVRREIHKMHAFVRFRVLQDAQGARHVAWWEPVHHSVRAGVPFFVDRFAAMHWSILTPRICVQWTRARLLFLPGADRAHAPAPDAGEALWIEYYRSIFNPSRLKTAAMLREMPRRYWQNLPETRAISELIREAPQRSARMVAEAAQARRRLPARHDAQPAAGPPRTARERLDDLARRARHCTDCPHASSATQLVWGEGEPGASLMIVGEQPGDHEDLAGRPFIGPAGQLLRQALAQLDWPLDRLYLTNAVKHFRFEIRGKRRIHKTPGQREQLACAQWLEAELALVRPQAVLALGGTAASSVLGRPVRVGDCIGRWQARDDGLPVWVVHHPAAILRRAESGAPPFDDWVEAMRPVGALLPARAEPIGGH